MSVVLSLKRVVGELYLVHDEVTVHLYTWTGDFEALGMEEIAVQWIEENGLSYHRDIAATGE